ncbi:MAG: discoidin domain-containing protein [Planctomycetota bacterium]
MPKRFPIAFVVPLISAFLIVSEVSADLIPFSSLSIESNTLGERQNFVAAGMINGSGLPSYHPGALHDRRVGGANGNWWLSSENNTTGTVVFDLGSEVLINQFFLWNESTVTGQQLNEIQIETSLAPNSGFTFTSLGSGLLDANTPGSFGQSDPIPAISFDFQPVAARYFRLSIISNNGATNFTGIAEVGFNSVPEPGALALSCIASLAIVSRRRRRQ